MFHVELAFTSNWNCKLCWIKWGISLLGSTNRSVSSSGCLVTGAGLSLIRSMAGFRMDIVYCDKEVATAGWTVVYILTLIPRHSFSLLFGAIFPLLWWNNKAWASMTFLKKHHHGCISWCLNVSESGQQELISNSFVYVKFERFPLCLSWIKTRTAHPLNTL